MADENADTPHALYRSFLRERALLVAGRRVTAPWLGWEVIVSDTAGAAQGRVARYYLLAGPSGQLAAPVQMEPVLCAFEAGDYVPAHRYFQFTFGMN
jgi:hypothetical protein